ncbi:hypothetical protein N7449_005449 [Penicillium cf. viridicatum]|uniref:Uncharacterized protein n=1 Tax=Penicillium cf. viridicatum TaxID=2972119 RepID=A0A9W9ML59_9EURO|nr:hypothetical protein N7449_005449 [Penicillium cf. viridicatum]
MDANTMENDKELNMVIEDTAITDEAKTTKTGAEEPVPKKKKKSTRTSAKSAAVSGKLVLKSLPRLPVCAIPLSHQRPRKLLRRLPSSPRLPQPPPSPTITTHPTNLEVDLLSGNKDEEMKEAEVEVGLGSAGMTLPFRGKRSV